MYSPRGGLLSASFLDTFFSVVRKALATKGCSASSLSGKCPFQACCGHGTSARAKQGPWGREGVGWSHEGKGSFYCRWEMLRHDLFLLLQVLRWPTVTLAFPLPASNSGLDTSLEVTTPSAPQLPFTHLGGTRAHGSVCRLGELGAPVQSACSRPSPASCGPRGAGATWVRPAGAGPCVRTTFGKRAPPCPLVRVSFAPS